MGNPNTNSLDKRGFHALFLIQFQLVPNFKLSVDTWTWHARCVTVLNAWSSSSMSYDTTMALSANTMMCSVVKHTLMPFRKARLDPTIHCLCFQSMVHNSLKTKTRTVGSISGLYLISHLTTATRRILFYLAQSFLV